MTRRERLGRFHDLSISGPDGPRLALIASSPFGLLVAGVLLVSAPLSDAFDRRVTPLLWLGGASFLFCLIYAVIRRSITDKEWLAFASFVLLLLAGIAANAEEPVLADQLKSTLMFPPLMVALFIPPKPVVVFGLASISVVWFVSLRAHELADQRVYGAFLISISIIVVTGFVSVMRGALDAERKRAEALSTLDQLTGLLNRRGMAIHYPAMMARARRDHHIFAVLVADVDHFKQINDSLGHKAGDHVLENIAHQIKDAIRPHELAVRLGGEEFAILASMKNSADVHVLAERVRRRVSGFLVGSPARPVTISVGVAYASLALHLPSDAVFDHFMSLADSLLYEAKNSGRDRVRAQELDWAGVRKVPVHAAPPDRRLGRCYRSGHPARPNSAPTSTSLLHNRCSLCTLVPTGR